MKVLRIYHNVTIQLNLTIDEVFNLEDCRKDIINYVDGATWNVIEAAFIDHPMRGFSGFMTNLKYEPVICGYNELFVLNALTKNERVKPELKKKIGELWSAFNNHRELLDSFRYDA